MFSPPLQRACSTLAPSLTPLEQPLTFPPPQLSGLSLTTTVLALTLHLHLAHRHNQHILLREQIDAIDAIALPTTTAKITRNGQRYTSTHGQCAGGKDGNVDAVTAVLARRGYFPREGGGLMDLVRERWNEGVERAVRRVREGAGETVEALGRGRGWEREERGSD
ncbi:hypothetical protein GX48_05269 [Paracoccidioides brasiliensis]|nr:hypothetical protein GX48_05269 [Paracoccidioides brasiliensis]